MKLKLSFRGWFLPFFGGLWREYKLIMVFLAAALLLLLTSIMTYAQGERPLPVVNYGAKTVRLADFGDKLVILDFWATYCAPCRLLLPRYDSLQRVMGDRLQFVLVSHEGDAVVSRFLKGRGYSLPSVVRDTALARAFPHNSIPFEVWLYRGKVVATTDGDAVTLAELNRVLAGDGVAGMPQKVMAPFDEDEPLLVNGNGWNISGKGTAGAPAPIVYQSLVTPYNPHLNSIAGVHRTDERINVFALNAGPLSLYHLAAAQLDPMLDVSNRYVVELPDSLRERVGANLRGVTPGSWLERYAFCYNLCLPPGFKAGLGDYILADLNRFFRGYLGVEAVVESRRVPCLVLKSIRKAVPGRQRDYGPLPDTPLYRSDTTVTIVRGLPVSQLVMRLAYTYRRLSEPLVDETGLIGPVDIRLEGNIADRRVLEVALRANGLELVEGMRSLPMVIIRRVSPDFSANQIKTR